MSEDNLTNINEGRKKKAKSKIVMGSKKSVKEEIEGGDKKPSKPRKEDFAVVEKVLSNWIDGSDKYLSFAFGTTFKVFISKDYGAARCVIKIDSENNTAQYVKEDEIAAELSLAMERPALMGSAWDIDFDQCKKVAKRWVSTRKKSLPEPKSIVFLSDPELAFGRLPFDPLSNTSTIWPATDFPILNASLGRMTNADAFCAWVGSLFFPDSNRKQAIWLWGQGDGGKSFWQDVLSFLVGGSHAVADLSASILKSDFWKTAVVGKNLVLIREAEAKFLKNGEFKGLLGDSSHQINPKGKDFFTVNLRCFALFASNERPSFPNDSGIKNRIISCKVEPIPEAEQLGRQILLEKIQPELQSFVSYCMSMYVANGPGKIKVQDHSDLQEAIEMYDSGYHSLFDKLFLLDPQSYILTVQYGDALEGEKISRLGKEARMFADFVKREYDGQVIWDFKKISGKTTRIIQGLALKDQYKHLPPPT